MILDAKGFDKFQALGRKIFAVGGSFRAVKLYGIDADGIDDFEERGDGFIYENADLRNKGGELRDDACGGGWSDITRTAGEENEAERIGTRVDCGASVIEIGKATNLNAN